MLSALDDPVLGQVFGVRSMRFRHDLRDRAELTVAGAAAIVDQVPGAWVFAHAAQRDPHEGRGCEAPVDRIRLPDLVREIEHSDTSVRIYNLERTSQWDALTEAIEPRVRAFVGRREGGVDAVNLGLFVASPGTVTPAHPDRHHNLLLQVEGRREIWLEDDPDRRRHHLRVLDYLECPAAGVTELPPARSLVLGPGDGVYIPPYAFHWTQLFDQPGLAVSIGFSTRATVVGSEGYDFDRRRRRHGAAPRPSAPLSVAGRAKATLEQVARRRRVLTPTPRVTVGTDPGGTDA